jgi:hypothetical protein
MSRANSRGVDVIARWEIEPLSRARRGVDERLLLALPWLGRRLVSATVRLPAGSRLRRAVVTRLIRVGVAANNRRDYAAMCAFFAPDLELYVYPDDPESRGVDFDAVYYGSEGYVKSLEIWKAPFGAQRWDLHELIDPGGDRIGARAEQVGRGAGSGAEVRWTQFIVWQFEGGVLRRQWMLASEAAMMAVLEGAQSLGS